jgi:hypothetical protein
MEARAELKLNSFGDDSWKGEDVGSDRNQSERCGRY